MKEVIPSQSDAENLSVIDAAYDRALKYLDEKRIDPNTFRSDREGQYDVSMVEADVSKVEELKKEFELKDKNNPEQIELHRLATIFEVLLSKHISESNWMGGNAQLIHTSDYDDFINHADGVLNIKTPSGDNNFMALGVDVTFSKAKLKDKFDRIRKGIASGRMTSIKYFELPDGSIKGELKKIPSIVLGAESKTVRQMVEQSLQFGNEIFRRHWLQFQLLEMAEYQCNYFALYAEKVNKQDVANIYKSMAEKIGSIRRLREKIINDVAKERDGMMDCIKNLLPEESRLT